MAKDVRSLLISILILAFAVGTLAQTLEEQLKQTEQAMQELRDNPNAMLSPKNIKAAEKSLKKARKDFDKGKKEAKIVENLAQANQSIGEANRVILRGSAVFRTTLKARDDCNAVQSAEHALDTYKKAEKTFAGAISTFEAGKSIPAKKKALSAESMYRQAELTSIKHIIMGKARTTIAQAELTGVEPYAPLSLQRAKTHLDKSESILDGDRYARQEAQQEADLAAYEARHAIYFAENSKSLEGTQDWYEKVILNVERNLNGIARQIDYDPAYDKGVAKPMVEMAMLIKSLKEGAQSAESDVASLMEKEAELISLRAEVVDLNEQLARMREQEQRRRARAKSIEDERFQRLGALFDGEEAVVRVRGKDVAIDLLTLAFAEGEATIQPDASGLLGKAVKALNLYPDKRLVIEAVAGSAGENDVSRDRADGVRKYLLDNGVFIPADSIQVAVVKAFADQAAEEAEGESATGAVIVIVIKEAKGN